MDADSASFAEMNQPSTHPAPDPPALDGDALERLLAGDLPRAPAPPGYAEVAALLAATVAPPNPSELTGKAAALAELKAVTRTRSAAAPRRARTQPRRRRVGLAVAIVVGALATSGVAAATTGHLPGPIRDAARSILTTVGATTPTTPTEVGRQPVPSTDTAGTAGATTDSLATSPTGAADRGPGPAVAALTARPRTVCAGPSWSARARSRARRSTRPRSRPWRTRPVTLTRSSPTAKGPNQATPRATGLRSRRRHAGPATRAKDRVHHRQTRAATRTKDRVDHRRARGAATRSTAGRPAPGRTAADHRRAVVRPGSRASPRIAGALPPDPADEGRPSTWNCCCLARWLGSPSPRSRFGLRASRRQGATSAAVELTPRPRSETVTPVTRNHGPAGTEA